MFRYKATVGLAALAVLSCSVYARPVKNSFINRPVTDTADLIRHIQADAEVYSRFSRHFAMNKSELISYLSGLRVQRTQKDGMYQIYGVPENGRIHSSVQRIKKGDKLFVDGAGTPILVWVCGNPMTRGPKSPAGNPLAANISEKVTGSTIMDVNPVNVTSNAVITSIEPAAVEMSIPSETFIPPVITTGSDIKVVSGGWGILPGLLLLGGNKGGGTPAVPEPATIAALTLGGAMLLSRKKRKNRN